MYINTHIYRHAHVYLCYLQIFSLGKIIFIYKVIIDIVGMTTEEDLKYNLSIIVEDVVSTLKTA